MFPGVCLAEEEKVSQTMDVLETENVLLECRFSPDILKSQTKQPNMYWIRSNRNGHINVAFDQIMVANNYS